MNGISLVAAMIDIESNNTHDMNLFNEVMGNFRLRCDGRLFQYESEYRASAGSSGELETRFAIR